MKLVKFNKGIKVEVLNLFYLNRFNTSTLNNSYTLKRNIILSWMETQQQLSLEGSCERYVHA